MIQKEKVQKRPLNWIPVLKTSRAVPEEIAVSQEDLFPKGEIVKYFSGQDYGFIRDQHGRDVYFHLGEIDFVGPKNSKNFIKVGSKIGYDLSWTSHGQHVRRIKIY